jgi:hypothetical protein
MKSVKIEYIDGNKQLGIKYDFNLIKKEFRKLKIPKDVYDPTKLPLEMCKWFLSMSERSRGKTTNLILLGMIFNKLYGTRIQYIRSGEDKIAPKITKNLFDTIKLYGYVEKLTDGKYNSVEYNSRKWFLCNRDLEGNITEKAETQFMDMLAVSKSEDYKSGYETGGLGDFIIFDEFIEKTYYPNEFTDFMDLHKTISRGRLSVIAFLASNTISKTSPYFSEFMIRDDIDKMERGDVKLITTPKGTKIMVEILGERPADSKKYQEIQNSLYYGFNNSKLASITGENTWSMFTYPHTPKDFRILNRKRYIDHNGKLIQMEICEELNEHFMFINCHPATKTYDDSVIYSLEIKDDRRRKYGFGFTKKDNFLWSFYERGLFRYSDNSTGDLIENYILMVRKSHTVH